MTAALALLLSPARVFARPFLRARGQGSFVADLPGLAGGIAVLSGSLRHRTFYGVDRHRRGDARLLSVRRERECAGVASLRERGASVPERRERNRDVAYRRRVPRKPVEAMSCGAGSRTREVAVLFAGQRRCGIRSALLLLSEAAGRRTGTAFRPSIGVKFSARPRIRFWQVVGGGGAKARATMAEGARLVAFESVGPWRVRLIPWTSLAPR